MSNLIDELREQLKLTIAPMNDCGLYENAKIVKGVIGALEGHAIVPVDRGVLIPEKVWDEVKDWDIKGESLSECLWECFGIGELSAAQQEGE